MATASAGKPLDRDLFGKLILMLDSPYSNERERAFGQIMRMCGAAGLRFCDAVTDVLGQGNRRVAELEAELEEARRGGDQLADELVRKDAVIAELRKAERTRKRICRRCETKRRVIGGLMGLMILAGWSYKYPPQEVTPRWTGYGVMLAAAPVVFLVCRWAVLSFRRRNHWVTWRDNDVFREAADRWNGFLRKFLIEVDDD